MRGFVCRSGTVLMTTVLLALGAASAAAQASPESVAPSGPDDASPAASTAARMVASILAGDDEAPAWDALATALAANAPLEAAPAELAEQTSETSFIGVADLLPWPEPGVETYVALSILGLGAIAAAAVLVGLLRRVAGSRRATVPARRRSRRPTPRVRRPRKTRTAPCRDAERLEARLRASRAA